MQLFSTVIVVDGEKAVNSFDFNGLNSHVEGRKKFNELVKQDGGLCLPEDVYQYSMASGMKINLALIFAPEDTDPKLIPSNLFRE